MSFLLSLCPSLSLSHYDFLSLPLYLSFSPSTSLFLSCSLSRVLFVYAVVVVFGFPSHWLSLQLFFVFICCKNVSSHCTPTAAAGNKKNKTVAVEKNRLRTKIETKREMSITVENNSASWLSRETWKGPVYKKVSHRVLLYRMKRGSKKCCWSFQARKIFQVFLCL